MYIYIYISVHGATLLEPVGSDQVVRSHFDSNQFVRCSPDHALFHWVSARDAVSYIYNAMCIEQMGERIDTLEANLAAAHAATAAERAATATVKFDLAAVQADMAAVRADEDAARAEARAALPLFDIERWPRCGKRVSSGISDAGQKMLRLRDEARCEEIKAVKEFAGMAEEATKAARRSELCAWKSAAATMQRAMDAEGALERLQTEVRQRTPPTLQHIALEGVEQ